MIVTNTPNSGIGAPVTADRDPLAAFIPTALMAVVKANPAIDGKNVRFTRKNNEIKQGSNTINASANRIHRKTGA